jgi:ribosomal protein S18 acetylase RimI-like enzyme
MSTLLPSLAVYEGLDGEPLLPVVQPLYAEIYAEPPYCEGPKEVQDFAAGWPDRVKLPGFRLVIAHTDGEPIGFSFGHRLPSDTDWWDGLLDPVPKETMQEHDGRTFAVIELAVRQPYRARGLGRLLHHTLLSGRPEQRVTLLARPEAGQAQAAYRSWGYRVIGRLRPAPDAPVYLALARDLPFPA